MERTGLLLLLFLMLPVVLALTPAEEQFYTTVTLEENTYSCGGFITCEAYIRMPVIASVSLASLQINLENADGALVPYAIQYTVGHYENVTTIAQIPSCIEESFVAENGTIVSNSTCTYSEQTTIIPVLVWHGQELLPGENIVRIWSSEKPAHEIVDWNFVIPGIQVGANLVTFDTREKGWALWGNGENSDDFGYYRSVLLNSTVTSNLTDFPAYFVLNTSGLIAEGKLQGNCSDLRPANETDLLDYEVESGTCNSTATIVWVRVPNLQSGGYNITIYYGKNGTTDQQDSAGVWSNGYVSVWHGFNGTDSTGRNVMIANGGATNTSGYFSRGFRLHNSTTQYWSSTAGVLIPNGSAARTVTSWVNGTSFPAGHNSFAWAYGTSTDCDGFGFAVAPSGTNGLAYGDGACDLSMNASSAVSVNTWHWWGMMYNGSVYSTYFDGSKNVESAKSITTSGATIVLGNFPALSSCCTAVGVIDEFRIANVTRTADWMKAEYAQTYAVGSEQMQVGKAAEAAGRTALLQGIASSEVSSSYTSYTDRQVYIRLANGSQYKGTFDVFVASGSKRWAFNYDQNTTAGLPVFANISPVFWVWQKANMTSSGIINDSSAFINATN